MTSDDLAFAARNWFHPKRAECGPDCWWEPTVDSGVSWSMHHGAGCNSKGEPR